MTSSIDHFSESTRSYRVGDGMRLHRISNNGGGVYTEVVVRSILSLLGSSRVGLEIRDSGKSEFRILYEGQHLSLSKNPDHPCELSIPHYAINKANGYGTKVTGRLAMMIRFDISDKFRFFFTLPTLILSPFLPYFHLTPLK